MLVSTYNVTFNIASKLHFWFFGVKNVKNCRNVHNIVIDFITYRY